MRRMYLSTSAIAFLIAACSVHAETRLNPHDQDFINQAWCANQSDVDLSRLAEQRATRPDVRAFAKKMVDEHSQMNQQLTDVAHSRGAALPKNEDNFHRQQLRALSSAKGSEFDRQYMEAMIQSHQKSVALYQDESRVAGKSDIGSWANSSVPRLRQHLQTAMRTGQDVGAPSAQVNNSAPNGNRDNRR